MKLLKNFPTWQVEDLWAHGVLIGAAAEQEAAVDGLRGDLAEETGHGNQRRHYARFNFKQKLIPSELLNQKQIQK